MSNMTRFLVTLLLVAVPYLLLVLPMSAAWNEHTRTSAVSYTALVVLAVVLWMGAWEMAG